MNTKSFLSIFMSIQLFVGCSTESNSDAAPDLIDVVQHPEQFLGKIAGTRGCFSSSRHGMAIFDCDNRELLLPVKMSLEASTSSNGKLLLDAGYRQWPPGNKVKITARFDGVLLDHKAEGEGFYLIIENVSEIVVHDEPKQK